MKKTSLLFIRFRFGLPLGLVDIYDKPEPWEAVKEYGERSFVGEIFLFFEQVGVGFFPRRV